MGRTSSAQLSLFSAPSAARRSAQPPAFDRHFRNVERTTLEDGAWIEVARAWLAADDVVFADLRDRLAWKTEDRTMYEKRVAVPRLYAVVEEDDRVATPIVEAMRLALNARYETDFSRVSAALYRDGSDSVAWHGDYVARRMESALVATVSLGAPRRFLLRRKQSIGTGARAMSIPLGGGDLIVMGGTCQRTYEHAVPKVAHAEPRIALMYRPVWEE